MPLKPSELGLLKSFNREGIVLLLKQTIPHMIMVEDGAAEIDDARRRLSIPDEDEVMDALVDMQLAADQVSAGAKSVRKQLVSTLKKVETYLREASR